MMLLLLGGGRVKTKLVVFYARPLYAFAALAGATLIGCVWKTSLRAMMSLPALGGACASLLVVAGALRWRAHDAHPGRLNGAADLPTCIHHAAAAWDSRRA